MPKTVSVHRFDYELNSGTWTVYIAAYKQEDAIALLRERVGAQARVSAMSVTSRIDLFEMKVVNDILAAGQPAKKGRGRPKGSVKKKVVTKK